MRLLLALLLAPILHAATFLVPSDAELVQSADDIVIATGVSSLSMRDARGAIVTRFTLRVEEVLKGPRSEGSHLELTELGGVVGNRSLVVPGSPRYEPGVRYLVFTSTNRNDEPVTRGMALGQFRLDGQLAIRRDVSGFDGNLEGHAEPLRDARRFVRYIADTVAMRGGSEGDYLVTAAGVVETDDVLLYSRTSFLLEDGSLGYRWRDPSVNWVRNGNQPGTSDEVQAVLQGLAAWNATDSSIDYRDAGVDPLATAGLNPDDGRNAVLFNDPNNEIPDNTGIVGVGGASGGDPYTLDGEQFFEILEGDIVISEGSFAQNCLNTILTHELGHTLGIRHSNQPAPGTVCGTTAQCTGLAIMNSSIQCSWNGALRGWDENAAATVYGDGVECEAPSIVAGPPSIVVKRGKLILIGVSASGTETLRYDWYEGERGVTTSPVGVGNAQLTLPAGRQQTTTFWVRVSNDCGSVDSAVATVTIPGRRRSVRQ